MFGRRLIIFGLAIYSTTKLFPKDEIYGLVSQMRRASISIFANIAEGYERHYRKEYIQFLMIAKGSLGEMEAYLMFAKDLNYINKQEFSGLDERRREIARLLLGLIKSLKNK